MSLEGTVLGGKYKLIQRIGEGGMGSVYEGEHLDIRRRVAVKLMQPHHAANPEAVSRFRREAQIAGSLGHDNICDVLDVGTSADGSHFLVMELLRGSSLAEILASTGPLPAKRALAVVAQVLDALSAAHAAGVVHRDLKPENVFVTKMGEQEDFVKVLDFGISKIVADSILDISSMTKTGSVMGTPYYMAPEQARGQKDQDHRVDVYATGVLLYEMLTCRRPFDGDTFNELLIKIVTEPFTPPRAIKDDIPANVEAIVLRAMSRSRDDRYADAAAMRHAVAEARLGISEVTATRLPTMATATGRETPFASTLSSGPQRPHASGGLKVALGAVAALVVVGGVVASIAMSGDDAGTSDPATTFTASRATAASLLPATAMPRTSAPQVAALPMGSAAPETALPETQDPATARAGRRTKRTSAGEVGPGFLGRDPRTAAPAAPEEEEFVR